MTAKAGFGNRNCPKKGKNHKQCKVISRDDGMDAKNFSFAIAGFDDAVAIVVLRCRGDGDETEKEKNDTNADYFPFSHWISVPNYLFKCDISLKRILFRNDWKDASL
jgi:hypothetical protein